MLENFLSSTQYAREHAENPDGFQLLAAAWESILENMPKTYETCGEHDEAVAYIHYSHGDWHWYVTEMDVDTDGEGQQQAFGLVCGFETELGYVDIPELLEAGVEFDLRWAPRSLAGLLELNRRGS